MATIDLAFNTALPSVQDPAFAPKLALRLLDLLCGRDQACTPDATPLNANGDTYTIGHANDFWLIDMGNGLFRVCARHLSPTTLEGAMRLLIDERRHQIIGQN